MEMEEMILGAVKRQRGELTPARLAKDLGSDLNTVNKGLVVLERCGKLRVGTLEGMLRAGK